MYIVYISGSCARLGPSLGRGHRVVEARKNSGFRVPHRPSDEVFPPVDALLYAEFLLRDPLMRPPFLPHAEARGAGDLTRAEEGAQGHRAADSGHNGVHLSGMEMRDKSTEEPGKGRSVAPSALGNY